MGGTKYTMYEMCDRVRSEAVRSVFPYARDSTLLLKKEVRYNTHTEHLYLSQLIECNINVTHNSMKIKHMDAPWTGNVRSTTVCF